MNTKISVLVEDILIKEDVYCTLNENSALVLGISPDNKVHFDTRLAEDFQITSQLVLKNYNGKLLVPRYTGINIPFIDRVVYGKIASPTRIGEGIGKIILDIDPESNLELCVKTSENCYINEKLQQKDKKVIDENGRYFLGRNFEDFEKRFAMHVYDTNRNVFCRLIDCLYNDTIDHNIFDIKVCKRYNLLYIDNFDGPIHVKYTEPAQVSGKYNIFYSLLSALSSSQFKIECAEYAHKYKKARQIRDETGHIRLNADRLNKIMQESKVKQ